MTSYEPHATNKQYPSNQGLTLQNYILLTRKATEVEFDYLLGLAVGNQGSEREDILLISLLVLR